MKQLLCNRDVFTGALCGTLWSSNLGCQKMQSVISCDGVRSSESLEVLCSETEIVEKFRGEEKEERFGYLEREVFRG